MSFQLGYGIVIATTTLWVWADARGRDWSGDDLANRPWKWIVGSLCLWMLVFPLYLVRRRRAPHY